ncbi:MAG: CapA family protein [Patescibacteria group bacterium]|jgi:poly-gamma-glutamate synthesis protein (capsule biosynthesis protein)
MRSKWFGVLVIFGLTFPGFAHASATLVFSGDVMLGRSVRDQINRRGGGNGAWVTANLAKVFRQADLAFVNLESPFLAGSASSQEMIFRADPKHVTALTGAGIDVVSFANNHSRNQGSAGIQATVDLLQKNRILVAGAGSTSKVAYAPRFFQAGAVPVAVLAYTYGERVLTTNIQKTTIANVDIWLMQAEVKKVRATGRFVVVSLHAGNEYTVVPNSLQKTFAHAAVDAGADLVIGHHPHWVQPVEKYKGKHILYSLGNLVFDQTWSKNTQEGAVARVTVSDRRQVTLEVLPVKIERTSQPRFMSASEAKPVLQRMLVPISGKL